MAQDKIATVPQEGPNQALLPKDLTPDIVRKYINKLADDKEVMFFLQVCASQNLNPFKREAFLIKYKADDPGQIVVAYGVFIARAERSLRLKGWRTWVEYAPADEVQAKDPIRAWIEIWREDWPKPFVHSVRFSEYIGRKFDGTKTKMWETKAETMIRKVVTAQGFRLCFPDELGDLPFTTEELGQDEPEHNAPTGPMPAAKVEKYEKPKAEDPPTVKAEIKAEAKEEPKVLIAEVVKPEEKEPEAPKSSKPVASKPAKPSATPATAPAKPAEAKSGMAPTALKERILNLMGILEKDYGKDPASMYTAIQGRLKSLFGHEVENFPDELSALEAAKVIAILENTYKSEEEKRSATKPAEEEAI